MFKAIKTIFSAVILPYRLLSGNGKQYDLETAAIEEFIETLTAATSLFIQAIIVAVLVFVLLS